MRITRHCTFWAIALATTLAGALRAQDISTKDLLDGLTNPSRWLTYSGDYTGQRFSPLAQITASNVERLTGQWAFQTGVTNETVSVPDRRAAVRTADVVHARRPAVRRHSVRRDADGVRVAEITDV